LKNGAVSKFSQGVHLMHMREMKSRLNVSIGILADLLQVPHEPRATKKKTATLRALHAWDHITA
jgi:hypothetical protein